MVPLLAALSLRHCAVCVSRLPLTDVCSSWISHYPEGYSAETCGRVSGLGMNEVRRGVAASTLLTRTRSRL